MPQGGSAARAYTVRSYRLGGNLALDVYSAGAADPAPASVVVSAIQLTPAVEIPGIGVLGVDPLGGAAFAVTIPDGDAPARFNIAVRNDPTLAGFVVFTQAVVTDGTGIESLRLTNVVGETVIF